MIRRKSVCTAAVSTALLALMWAGELAYAGGDNNPLLYMVKFEEFEWSHSFNDPSNGQSSDNAFAWRGEAWVGKDQDKLWLKTRGETSSDATEEFELQLLYDRAITPFWDLQVGWRGDFQPATPRDWLAVGVEGLAPGFLETELTGFVGGSGRTSARGRVAYEMLFTQKLILEPELELNWYGKDDPANGIGSGLADIEAGLRLRYAIRREIAPYIGISWTGLYGDTRRMAEAAGNDSNDWQALAGLRFWF